VDTLTNTQVDRLGNRLRAGMTESDLRLLDAYRRSFADAYSDVTLTIRQHLDVEFTGRPAKSTTSIVEKLRRETIRLTQVQDVAGCRLVVSDTDAQDRIVEQLTKLFDGTDIIDRRLDPSHDYRAVHVVVRRERRLIEVQVRTALQHLWAELSEKLSDLLDPTIKYGGGTQQVRETLALASKAIAIVETQEKRLAGAVADSDASRHPELTAPAAAALRKTVAEGREGLAQLIRNAIDVITGR
jgi:putative GTP pyrophosphokinase